MSEKKQRKIKIIHDGDIAAFKTRVVDAETGEPIKWVRRVELVFDAREHVEARIYVISPEVEVEVDAEVIERPLTDKYPEPGIVMYDVGQWHTDRLG